MAVPDDADIGFLFPAREESVNNQGGLAGASPRPADLLHGEEGKQLFVYPLRCCRPEAARFLLAVILIEQLQFSRNE